MNQKTMLLSAALIVLSFTKSSAVTGHHDPQKDFYDDVVNTNIKTTPDDLPGNIKLDLAMIAEAFGSVPELFTQEWYLEFGTTLTCAKNEIDYAYLIATEHERLTKEKRGLL